MALLVGHRPVNEKEKLDFFERQAEAAYGHMYDVASYSDAAARYSDAKEALHSAIGLADAIGDKASAERLRRRLDQIKAVFRSQFS